jgi:hypothetical protein
MSKKLDIASQFAYTKDVKNIRHKVKDFRLPTKGETTMKLSLSFHEKSLWVMLFSLIVAFGIYFALALSSAQSPNVMPNQIGLFALLLVLMVVAQIAGHVVIALVDRRSQTDERDQLIELKGIRNASYVLATGVFLALCAALWIPGNFVFVHLLLGFWVLAQLVQYGSQLWQYRRGV